jgi:uncharacterized membrane protein (UPF0136 family)
MNAQLVLWVYILLLLAGGLAGYFKAGSKVSLITSGISAALLSLFALDVLPFAYYWIVLAVLVVVFGIRLAKTKKIMPAGLLFILTLAALVVIHLMS